MKCAIVAMTAASLLCSVSSRADGIVRKGGEWRSVVTGLTPTPQTVVLCFAPATAEQAVAKLATGKQCTRRDIRFEGNHVTLDIVCGNMSLKGTSSMNGDSAYRSDFTFGYGEGSAVQHVHVVTEGRWIGACKPGETPQ